MPRKASVASRGKPGGATRKGAVPKIQAGARPDPFDCLRRGLPPKAACATEFRVEIRSSTTPRAGLPLSKAATCSFTNSHPVSFRPIRVKGVKWPEKRQERDAD